MPGKILKSFVLTDEQSKLVGDNIRLLYSFMNKNRMPPMDPDEIYSELSLARALPGRGDI